MAWSWEPWSSVVVRELVWFRDKVFVVVSEVVGRMCGEERWSCARCRGPEARHR